MLYELTMLAASLAHRGYLPYDKAFEVARDVTDVALVETPLFKGDDGPLRTGRLVLVWHSKETSGQVNIHAVFPDTSIGPMQFRPEWLTTSVLAPFAVSTEDVLKGPRTTGLRLGLAIMRHLAETCGSVVGGLNAYASGSCKGNSRSHALVAFRCSLAGGC